MRTETKNCLNQITEQLDLFCKRVDEKIDHEHQQLEACKKQSELEMRMEQELKLNEELTARLDEISRRGDDLERVCAAFESRLTITESDRYRLDNAKDMFKIAKELTGIRFDFSAPQDEVKGYIKSESRKVLQPFSLRAPAAADALWALLVEAHHAHHQ